MFPLTHCWNYFVSVLLIWRHCVLLISGTELSIAKFDKQCLVFFFFFEFQVLVGNRIFSLLIYLFVSVRTVYTLAHWWNFVFVLFIWRHYVFVDFRHWIYQPQSLINSVRFLSFEFCNFLIAEKVYYTACVSVVVNFFPIGECDEFRCGNVWGQ